MKVTDHIPFLQANARYLELIRDAEIKSTKFQRAMRKLVKEFPLEDDAGYAAFADGSIRPACYDTSGT